MTIVGFSFLQFNCERKKGVSTSGKLDVRHFMGVESVDKTEFKVASQAVDALTIQFKFGVLYGKDLGKVEILGEIIYTDTPQIIEESLKGYKADKKLASMVQKEIFRFAYSKSIVKVLELSTDLNLPAPIPLPKINFEEEKQDKK